MRTGSGPEVLRRLEGPIPVAQEDGDVVRSEVGYGQVQPPIAIEVAHGNGTRTVPGGEVPSGLEVPIPVAQEHRDAVGIDTGHGQVLPPVAIEVAQRRRNGADASG